MQLAGNIVRFARALRRAGLAIGPDRALAAVQAVQAVGLDRRDDVRAALAAVMLDRHEQQAVFDLAFDAFWRDPGLPGTIPAPLPGHGGRGEAQPLPGNRRLADALAPGRQPRAKPAADANPLEAMPAWSDRERLARADFAAMTAGEFALARRLAEQLPRPVAPVLQRRHDRAPRGRIALRATLARMARSPGTIVPLHSRARRVVPPIVVLLDISGSMDRYARLLLHYVHGLTRRHVQVHTFTFGTRLTNITRYLRHRDPDVALALADAKVDDWKGGTRIASCLDEFNRCWARRVLGGNAAVLLVTDGLDRDEGGDLAAAAALLHRQAHQLVWLNPLLRFEGFEPRAAGVRAILRHVDALLPVHDLRSLADLEHALRAGAGEPARFFVGRPRPDRRAAR